MNPTFLRRYNRRIRCLVLFMIGMPGLGRCLADSPQIRIISPDQPSIWYNRAGDKLSQYLQWSDSKNELLLRVAYSELESDPVVWWDQFYVDNFELSFPSVRLDRSTKQLYVVGKKGEIVKIGHLESGVFGCRVVLGRNFELSVHRENGIVNAEIHSDPLRKQ